MGSYYEATDDIQKVPVVISGMSGRLPESNNLQEFYQHLLDGDDMITTDDRRWPPGLHGLPKRHGKIKSDLSKFDAEFFNIPPQQANRMDVMLKQLLEVTYEAIVDSGISPDSLRGSNTGVFIGTSAAESHVGWTSNVDNIVGYEMIGCATSMLANRLSFFFDFKGPSYVMDAACASSLLALDSALRAIKTGQCNSAIVGGVNICLRPATSMEFNKLGMLSKEGACKSFDASGDGYCRSEGIVSLFLQKEKNANRIYAKLLHSKTNTDGHKDTGITYPSSEMQKRLLLEIYEEANIDPFNVTYIEAHGTGTKAGDPQELKAIADVFCGKERKTPLLIGSVKSNMGHSEGCSGLAGVVKVLLSMEHGTIPGNLHYKTPNPDIEALTNGQFQVVDNPVPWPGGYAGISSFGFGGSNVHVVLQPNKQKVQPVVNCDQTAPRLFTFSGRTRQSLVTCLTEVNKHPEDIQMQALLQESSSVFHPYRGFTILNSKPGVKVIEKTHTEKRPVWYIFSGMGSQWCGMGRDMMTLPAFKESIMKSDAVLQPLGIHLYDMIMTANEKTFDNPRDAFVGIASIQIAMVDILKSLGIKPDGLIGHSVGELLCAYVDGGITAEETLLAAYWRGQCIINAKLPPGGMAAVGMSWKEVKDRCPPGVVPACHNTRDTVTVSGLLEDVRDFANQLKSEDIFVREVYTSGVAFHSPSMQIVAKELKPILNKVIKKKQPRTSKWISTSIPKDQWNDELAKYSSSDYHINNLVSPVLFQEALENVPKNAVLIEIAPHCLLQAVLKRSLSRDCEFIGLNKKDCEDNLNFFYRGLGSLFLSGQNFNPMTLYKKVKFPVSPGTTMLSPLISWDHSTTWDVPYYKDFNAADSTVGSGFVYDFDLSTDSDRYLHDHFIDGRILFPATGYIVMIWKTVGRMEGKNFEEISVNFENVTIHRATILKDKGKVQFRVNISKESGHFEIVESKSIVVSGYVHIQNESNLENPLRNTEQRDNDDNSIYVNTEDVYKEWKLRRYTYGPKFQGIMSVKISNNSGQLYWTDNWVTYLDAMLQSLVYINSSIGLKLPTKIHALKIDPMVHRERLISNNDTTYTTMRVEKTMNICCAGGVEFYGLYFTSAPKNIQKSSPVIQEMCFVPNNETCSKENKQQADDVSDPLLQPRYLKTCLDIVVENVPEKDLKVCELSANKCKMYKFVIPHLNTHLLLDPDYKAQDLFFNDDSKEEIESMGAEAIQYNINEGTIPDSLKNTYLVIVNHNQPFTREGVKNVMKFMEVALIDGGFLLLRYQSAEELSLGEVENDLSHIITNNGFQIVAIKTDGLNSLVLCRKHLQRAYQVLDVTDLDFSWVDEMKKLIETSKDDILLQVCGTDSTGVIGMVNCLTKETHGGKIRCLINTSKEPIPADELNKQLNLGLVMNVYKDGTWGTYRHLPFTKDLSKQTVAAEHAYVNVTTKGDLSSLRWIESPLKHYAQDTSDNCKKVFCNVNYSSLNFRDIMLATGKLSSDAIPKNQVVKECLLGMEFSGTDRQGRRLMGIVPGQGLSTTILADDQFLWPIPDDWTLEEAASVPLVYATAYYALVVRARIKKGDKVLIHSGSGGVGQAAISVALHYGCQVFITVGNDKKKRFLQQKFPQLSETCFSNSRDTSFERDILRETNEEGVDVILNSLAGDKFNASLRILATHGKFLELGKFDIYNNTSLGMSIFLKNITFHGVLLDSLFNQNNEESREVFDLVSSGIKEGVVQPLKRTVFEKDQVEAAFRYMSQGVHIGKIVIKIREEGVSSPKNLALPSIPHTYFYPTKSYIITGGLGGVGLELTNWMSERGAKHIIVTSRSGVTTGYQRRCLKRLEERGVNVVVSKKNVVYWKDCEELIKDAQANAPLGGVFHLAMVLKSGLIENQTLDFFKSVGDPKISGTVNLDKITRQTCVDTLDWFVAFSSMISGRGSEGLCSYGFANSFLERICEQRKRDNLPGLAIQWGAIADVGIAIQTMGEDCTIAGSSPQPIFSCLDHLDMFLSQSSPVVSCYVKADKQNKKLALRNASKTSVIDQIAYILGLKDVSYVDPDTTLSGLGLDSLMGVQIKQLIERDLHVALQMKQVRRLTLNGLRALESEEQSNTVIKGNLLY